MTEPGVWQARDCKWGLNFWKDSRKNCEFFYRTFETVFRNFNWGCINSTSVRCDFLTLNNIVVLHSFFVMVYSLQRSINFAVFFFCSLFFSFCFLLCDDQTVHSDFLYPYGAASCSGSQNGHLLVSWCITNLLFVYYD